MFKNRVVWKLGGSVLENEESYQLLADVIQRYLDTDKDLERLYIVVSAMKGETNKRVMAAAPDEACRELLVGLLSGTFADGNSKSEYDTPNLSSFLLEGEMESARLLKRALEGRSVEAKVVTQHDYFPIASKGSYLRGEFDHDLSRSRFSFFEKLSRDRRVVILSGFGAVNMDGEPTLLGRNASDYVAALISKLDEKVGEVIYIKDVEGIYENFFGPEKKLINLTNRLELLEMGGTDQVLDRRVLEVISCDFFVTDIKMENGTRVLV